MTEQKKYQVFAKSPIDLDLGNYGVEESQEQAHPKAMLILSAKLTEEEYRKVYGPNGHLTSNMCEETYDEKNYTIRVFAADVLACENSAKSHQTELINCLLETEGKPTLDQKEMEEEARGYNDISPAALQILLSAAAEDLDPFEMNLTRVIQEMEEAGLTLADFVRSQ